MLLSSGEAYLADSRPEHLGRYELVEMIAEPEIEEDVQTSSSRWFPFDMRLHRMLKFGYILAGLAEARGCGIT